jgi:DNA-directed RNA polymerase specialized sigma24 family protein
LICPFAAARSRRTLTDGHVIEGQSFKTTVGAATSSISSENLGVLLREATTAARSLGRRLGLPSHEHEDLRQELLVDLIIRFRWFDPGRGTLGVFAGTITRHRATRLANRICRERAIFVPITLKGRSRHPDDVMVIDTIATDDGNTAVLRQSHNFLTKIDRRLDLTRALTRLRPADLKFCTKLTECTPTEISRSGKPSRAALYRQIKRIRLRLLEEGVSWP